MASGCTGATTRRSCSIRDGRCMARARWKVSAGRPRRSPRAWVVRKASRRYNHAAPSAATRGQARGPCASAYGEPGSVERHLPASIGRLARRRCTRRSATTTLALYDERRAGRRAGERPPPRETSPGVLRMDHDGDRSTTTGPSPSPSAVQEGSSGPGRPGAGFIEFWRRERSPSATTPWPPCPLSARHRPDAAGHRTGRADGRQAPATALPGHIFSPETRLCHVCGEAAPEHAA